MDECNFKIGELEDRPLPLCSMPGFIHPFLLRPPVLLDSSGFFTVFDTKDDQCHEPDPLALRPCTDHPFQTQCVLGLQQHLAREALADSGAHHYQGNCKPLSHHCDDPDWAGVQG